MEYTFQLQAKLTELSTLRDQFEMIFEKEALFNDLTRKNILLALTELFVNVVKHGDVPETSSVQYEIHRSRDELEIVMRDWGNSYDPFSVPPPDISLLPESGYGVYLVRSLMDSFDYYPKTAVQPNTTRITKQA
ncbi:ATP-binding protein [candidate division KSB1 bacterium]|nr:ATP-binding protein [candidate division KSB1 bacterium]